MCPIFDYFKSTTNPTLYGAMEAKLVTQPRHVVAEMYFSRSREEWMQDIVAVAGRTGVANFVKRATKKNVMQSAFSQIETKFSIVQQQQAVFTGNLRRLNGNPFSGGRKQSHHNRVLHSGGEFSDDSGLDEPIHDTNAPHLAFGKFLTDFRAYTLMGGPMGDHCLGKDGIIDLRSHSCFRKGHPAIETDIKDFVRKQFGINVVSGIDTEYHAAALLPL
ncbi:hypothetical protein HDU77_003221 [Chytriomyces hyalinus]|nr:hypothetical protein HDU77_003221 [Chytriomyces hyalinus]